MIINADAIAALRTLPDATVQMCVTSPPYFGLRDYGVDGQIGLEPSPELYVSRLVEIFREVRRVLRDDGTLWVNIGDTYAGSCNGAAHYPDSSRGTIQATVRGNFGASNLPQGRIPNGCKAKDLIGVPWLLAFALRNDGWYLRQDIIWAKPNPIPESVTDRCTKSHEYIFLLSKSRNYYYNNAAVMDIANYDGRTDTRMEGSHKYSAEGIFANNKPQTFAWKRGADGSYLRNKRDVWTVPTQPYHNAHFATFPPELIRPCIRAGSRPGDVVLDPFFGAGTTGVVAIEEGRDYIGIELNAKYCELARKRLANTVQQLTFFETLTKGN